MHHLHNEILFNLEDARISREAEVHYQRLRDAGIEPGSSRRSLLTWLRTDRHSTVSSPVTNRPRPV